MGGNVKKKINLKDEDDLTPLHYAARYNHLEVVQLLIESGAGRCRLKLKWMNLHKTRCTPINKKCVLMYTCVYVRFT